ETVVGDPTEVHTQFLQFEEELADVLELNLIAFGGLDLQDQVEGDPGHKLEGLVAALNLGEARHPTHRNGSAVAGKAEIDMGKARLVRLDDAIRIYRGPGRLEVRRGHVEDRGATTEGECHSLGVEHEGVDRKGGTTRDVTDGRQHVPLEIRTELLGHLHDQALVVLCDDGVGFEDAGLAGVIAKEQLESGFAVGPYRLYLP